MEPDPGADSPPPVDVTVAGGHFGHAVLGTQIINRKTVFHQHGADVDVPALPPGHFRLSSHITVSENDPINRDSRIYRAKLHSMILGDVEIAVKILSDGERQRREAHIHFRIPHHINIVERILTDCFKYQGQSCIYIAMEQCDVQNLHAYVVSLAENNVPYDAEMFMSFAFQIATGLEFLHRYKILNRDLKPENILLSADKKIAKITDFGMSKEMTGEASTVSNLQPGTDGWRSPEILKNVRRITLASDMFSLGLIFHFLWSYGKHAFGDDHHAWNLYIKRGMNMTLDGLKIPNENDAKRLLKSLLSRNPLKRPSAPEVLRDTVFEVFVSMTTSRNLQLTKQSTDLEPSSPSCSGHQVALNTTVEGHKLQSGSTAIYSGIAVGKVQKSVDNRSKGTPGANKKSYFGKFWKNLDRKFRTRKNDATPSDPTEIMDPERFDGINVQTSPWNFGEEWEDAMPAVDDGISNNSQQFPAAGTRPGFLSETFQEGAVEVSDSRTTSRNMQLTKQSTDLEPSSPSCSGRQVALNTTGHLVEVDKGIYMDEKEPLRKGYQVYEGEQRRGKDVKAIALAIKIFSFDQTESDPHWYKRYCREANSMQKFHHPNVARIVHCGERINKPGEFYVAMRLCHALTLGDIDLDGQTQEQRTNIFLQICHGLKHLHDEEVAHLDLKPTNILFSIDGKNAVVSDFGLSKEADIKHDKKKTKTTIKRSSTRYGGTEGWSPVEMLRSSKVQGDHRTDFRKFRKSDIFSLGVVGNFTLCNKHHPFSDALDRDDTRMTHTNIKRECQPDLSCLESQLDDGFVAADLFRKLLSHKPEDRLTIDEVLQHCFFWGCSKKIEFFRDMHERYFNLQKLRSDGSEEQKLVYEPVQLGVDSSASSSTLSDSKRSNRLKELREVIGECWSEKVTKNPDFKSAALDVKAYENSLADLIRCICNYYIHRVGQDEEKPAETTLKLFSGVFPKLLPYLYKIMEPSFFSGLEKTYKTEIAIPGDMDLNDVLNTANKLSAKVAVQGQE